MQQHLQAGQNTQQTIKKISHLHSKVPTRSVHRAFLPQGLPIQSSLSWEHLTAGLPMYPDGQAHWGLWSRTLHWALRPQAFGNEQGLTQRPSLHVLSVEQSLLLEHSALTHPSTGWRWYPRGQRHTGLWLVVWQMAFGPHSVALHGSLQLPDIHDSLAMQSWSRRQPAVQTAPTQLSPLLQSLGLKHFCRQAPFEQTSPQRQSSETLQDLEIKVIDIKQHDLFTAKCSGDPKADSSKTGNFQKQDFLKIGFQMVVPFENRKIGLVF